MLLSFWQNAASLVGKTIEWAISVLNKFILNTDALPFAVWESIQISILQAIILFVSIIGFSYWLIEKRKKSMLIGLFFLMCFIGLRRCV